MLIINGKPVAYTLTTLVNVDGTPIGVQDPLPTNGDSVYNKDVDFDVSTIGTFSGDLTSIFGNYNAEITDSTATNPKTFTIHLERPVTSNKIGIGSQTGNFSNVKILLKDLAGTIRQYYDDSANDTKHTSNLYEFTPNTFVEIAIEFHTTDEVIISGLFVPKAQERHISAIDGIISVRNSSLIALVGDAVFTGEQEDTKNYGMIQCALFSDVACTFEIQFRSTPSSTWRVGDTYEVAAGEDKVWSFQSARRFMRIVVTNGPDAQSDFDLQTILKPVYVKPSSHPIGEVIKGNDDAELVKAQITAEKPDNTYTNIQATESENLKFANAEDLLNIAQGNVVGHSTEHKFGRGANIDTADSYVVLWDGAEYNDALKVYTYSADNTADIDRISSSNNNDTETLEIKGLDVNGNLVTQTKTLTGQTPAALDTPLWRVFRMANTGTSDLLGSVFCFVNVTTTLGVPDTLTNTRAMINNGNNQTLMSIYTIPAGKTGYIINWSGSLSSAKASSFNNLRMEARPFGGVFQLKHTSTLSSAGSSHIQHVFNVPQAFPAKTDFAMLSDSSVNDNAVSASFDLILIDD